MHRHVRNQFLDWLEHKTEKRRDIDAHLRDCEACSSYYRKMTQLIDPGVASDWPRLVPHPFIATRIAAIEAQRKHAQSEQWALRMRLSLEGIAVVLAVLIGIMLGRTFSLQPQQNTSDEIVTMYQNAVSQQDFSGQMELLYDTTEGTPQ